jgi:ABC-type transport system involved in multi-copper enzyme maturation permease subunit
MRTVAAVALDLLREALSRKWFLALGLAITLLIVTLGLTLRLEVVDGALAATSLFGSSLHHDIQAADVALRPVFEAASYVIFYGGILFGTLSCADFAPELLAPGRIEHLLSLPVRRAEVLAGTFLGVLALAAAGALYGAMGFTLVLSAKSGFWTVKPVIAAVLSCVAFSAVYGAMLAAAVFVRSAALSAAVGAAVFIIGIVASYRSVISELFTGFAARVFLVVTAPFPRFSMLVDAARLIATGRAVDVLDLLRLLLGTMLFAAAGLAIAIWEMERRDY